MREKSYLHRIEQSSHGFNVYYHKGGHEIYVFSNVCANVVEKMLGSDFDYFSRKRSGSATECCRPLFDWELRDLRKYQA